MLIDGAVSSKQCFATVSRTACLEIQFWPVLVSWRIPIWWWNHSLAGSQQSGPRSRATFYRTDEKLERGACTRCQSQFMIDTGQVGGGRNDTRGCHFHFVCWSVLITENAWIKRKLVSILCEGEIRAARCGRTPPGSIQEPQNWGDDPSPLWWVCCNSCSSRANVIWSFEAALSIHLASYCILWWAPTSASGAGVRAPCPAALEDPFT